MDGPLPKELLSKETRDLFIMATRIIKEDWVKVEVSQALPLTIGRMKRVASPPPSKPVLP